MTERLARLRGIRWILGAGFVIGMVLGSGLAVASGAHDAKSGSADAALSAAANRAAAPSPAADSSSPVAALKNLEFRNIGPATMGGRVDCYAVQDDNPDIIYVGLAAGGIFKTTNGGNTWTPIFDHETTSSIGAISIAPSDPSVIWVGTGEANNRQSASWGAGVYKSLDGGTTWQHVGLDETQSIGRVVVDPHDPNTVYVAALGGLWNANPERGVFKTTDGGKTWNKVLFVNNDTGVVDLAIDPQSTNILYAGAYERRRTAYGFNGGGPDGGIYKTNDAGATWRKITNGLPYADGSDVGRIAITVYPRNPNIVYARVQNLKGGFYRSEDKGENWTKMSDTNPRPSYFGVLAVDPNNDLRVWVGGAPLYSSEDGGKSFVTSRGQGVHSDYHALWIDPHDSNHMMVGVDGGIYMSHDGGHSWDHDNILAIGQFYEVTASNERPYKVCGGLQDNGSWCGPSQTFHGGILNSDWETVGGGDGFYNQLDPDDPNTDYEESQDGELGRRDLRTTESKTIRPREAEGEAPYRFQWRSPIAISHFDHKTIYYGGNFLFKSTDRGDSWTKLGPDLTNNENRREMKVLGKLPDKTELSREDGVEWWPCITVISESPLSANVIWVGTDDGNLQITRDAGKTWTNVAGRVPGVPKATYVSRVVASKYAEGTAYAAFNGHRSGDFHIYIFRTTDYGQSWRAISNGITDKDGTVEVVREDPKVSTLLYAGTERGLFISFDTGANWTRFMLNLPTVPVDDILIHPRDNDMILGTHGRSIWILDDITPIQEMAQAVNANVKLFDIRDAYLYREQGGGGGGGFGFGTHAFTGPNPPFGALVDFYLKTAPTEKDHLAITISDSSGKTVREIQCRVTRPGQGEPELPPQIAALGIPRSVISQFLGATSCAPKEGLNRFAWDLRIAPAVDPAQMLAGGIGGFFGGGGRGPLVDPGTYTVKVALGDQTETKTVKVEEDPRIEFSEADRAKRHDAIMRAYNLSRDASRGQREITGLRTALDNTLAAWKRPGAVKIPDNVQKAAEDLSKQVNEVAAKFAAPPPEEGGEMGGAGPALVYRPPIFSQRVGEISGALQGMSEAPTEDELKELDLLTKEISDALPQVDKLVKEGLPNLNKLMNDAGVPHIVIPQPGPPGGGRPRGDDSDGQDT
jgi:photosystem II stability/assembly factor-like uncharacterized protein